MKHNSGVRGVPRAHSPFVGPCPAYEALFFCASASPARVDQPASEGSVSRLWGRAIELGFTPQEPVEFLRSVAGDP